MLWLHWVLQASELRGMDTAVAPQVVADAMARYARWFREKNRTGLSICSAKSGAEALPILERFGGDSEPTGKNHLRPG